MKETHDKRTETHTCDLIDRQAAIAEFSCCELTPDGGIDANYAIDFLEQMSPAQPGWIPVTERLPRPNEEDGNEFYKAYLVQDGRWMDVARWDGKYWVAWGYSTVLLNVIAWHELPTPYREGGQDG